MYQPVGNYPGARAPPPMPKQKGGCCGSDDDESDTAAYIPTRPGRKRALCVGINYPDSEFPLNGCVNDCNNWVNILRSQYGFSDIRVLVDVDANDEDVEEDDPAYPSKKNMLANLNWLVSDAAPGDVIVFVYAGHGTQKSSWDQDEEDGMDECLCPADWEKFEGLAPGRLITDNTLKAVVDRLPKGVNFTMIADCCHSGTILDLPNVMDSGEGQPETEPHAMLKDPLAKRVPGLKARYLPVEFRAPLWASIFGTRDSANERRTLAKSLPTGPQVFCISGCRDDQCSADAPMNGKYQGAMSFCLQKALSAVGPNATYHALFEQGKQQRNQLKSTAIPVLDQWFQMSYSSNTNPSNVRLFQPVVSV